VTQPFGLLVPEADCLSPFPLANHATPQTEKVVTTRPGMVAHTCNPSYSGSSSALGEMFVRYHFNQ
jgi:hypothetical protein